MMSTQKIQFISQNLDDLYPDPPIPLNHTSDYTLLIAVLLSAQCTDDRVNLITPALFKKADTPQKMSKLSLQEITHFIKSCTYFNTKAANILALSQILVDEHQGQVPNTFEALEALPGVGHKTASVVMSQAFHIPAFPVDTHIHRLAARFGLSDGSTVEQTEKDLKKVFPKNTWNKRHLQIIYFGRNYCKARGHQIEKCPICKELYRYS